MEVQALIIFCMEMAGTVAFAASGAMTGISRRMDVFGVCVLGVVTAVGGGMMRDVMAGNTPFVFIKHVYACAALIGAFLYIFLYRLIPDTAAMLISSLAVVAIRLLAAHYRWNLPRIQK